MESETTRRDFIRGTTLATAGLLAARGTSEVEAAQPSAKHEHEPSAKGYPRDHAGPGGAVGTATDRGKLVPGLRAATEQPASLRTEL
jgi:hypothetical protein